MKTFWMIELGLVGAAFVIGGVIGIFYAPFPERAISAMFLGVGLLCLSGWIATRKSATKI